MPSQFRFSERYDRIQPGSVPRSLEEAAARIQQLEAALTDTHAKLQKTFKAIEQSSQGSQTQTVASAVVASAGAAGSGSSSLPANVRLFSQTLGSTGGFVNFLPDPFSSATLIVVWAWMLLDDGTMYFPNINPSGVVAAGFTVGPITGDQGGTIYGHAIAV